MFEKRLQKALKQDFKSTKDIVNYCRKEIKQNYSEKKLTDMQCICEYLIYKLENKLDITFSEYQQIQMREICLF